MRKLNNAIMVLKPGTTEYYLLKEKTPPWLV